jgi:Ca2+-binding RTX toxin-like protein
LVDILFDLTEEDATALGGTDTVKTALSSYIVQANVENLTYTGAGNFAGNGNGGNNSIAGLGGSDTLTGAGGADRLTGNDGADFLYGGMGNDVLSGGLGSDWLQGDEGLDVLTGGGGADKFVLFGSAAGNSDKIMDFVSGDGDKIAVNGADYGFAPGALDPDHFATGAATSAAGVGQFVYKGSNKALVWDANGTAAGGETVIATFATDVGLTAVDFVIL